MPPIRKLAVRIVLASLLLLFSVPAHAYLVYFRNGSTMEVQSHRVQGDKVYLKMQSGETGFNKDQIDLEKTLRDYNAYQAVIRKASKVSGDGDHLGALKLYQSLIAMDGNDAQAWFLRGKELMALKRYDEAVHDLMRVLERDPKYPQVNTRLGDIYFKQLKYNDAIDKYLKALDEDPKDKEAHLGLGMSYAKQDMYEGAITQLNRALELRPDYALAYAVLGYVDYKKSDFGDALAALDKAEKLDALLPEAHYYKGLVYGVLGAESKDARERVDYLDKSIEAFRKAVQLRKDFPEAHADLGVAFYKRGSVARAVEEFKTALSQKPDMAVAHNNLAGIYLRQGYYDEAVTEAQKAVSYEPNMAEAYFIMGNAYNNMKKYKAAARAYDKYLYYSPDGAMAGEVKARLDNVLRKGGQ
jgi:tetratricopeptide (TPR) repeat protein